jgi:hypothetical protein
VSSTFSRPGSAIRCAIKKSPAYPPRGGTPAWGGFYYSSAGWRCMVGRVFPIPQEQPSKLQNLCLHSLHCWHGMVSLSAAGGGEAAVLLGRKSLGWPTASGRSAGTIRPSDMIPGLGKRGHGRNCEPSQPEGESGKPRLPQRRPNLAPTPDPEPGTLGGIASSRKVRMCVYACLSLLADQSPLVRRDWEGEASNDGLVFLSASVSSDSSGVTNRSASISFRTCSMANSF